MRQDEKWYPVPPYRGEGWKIVDDQGEQVAGFEEREACELAAKLFNERNSHTGNAALREAAARNIMIGGAA